MSVTQSHTQIAQEYALPIDPSQQVRSMSSHHLDMLRQVPRTNPPVNMLASLGPSQQFAPQPPNAGAQQLPPHVGIPGNMIPNPPVQMNFVGNAAPQGAGMNNQAAAQAAANMQFRLGPQRTPQQTPGQPGVMGAPYNPMVNGVGGLGAPNAVGPNGLAVNPQAMAAGLPNGVMQQPIGGVRRVPGQPMGMNQGATIPGGMIPMATGVPPGSMVNGNPASVMMQQQIRQQQALAAAQAQQQSNVRLPPQLGPPGAMQMAARPGIHPTAGIIRTTSAQPMLGASPGTQQLPGAPLPNSAPNGFSPNAMMQPQAIQQNGFNSAMQNRPPSVQIAHPASAPPMHPGQPPRTTPDGTAGNMFMSFPGANRMTGIEQPHMNLPPGSSSPPAQQPQHAGDIPQQMVGMHSNVPGRQGLSGIQIQQHVEQLRPGSSSGSQQQGQPPQMQQSPRAAPNVFGLSTQPPPNVPSRPSSQNVMRTPRTPHTPISAPQQTASHHASPRNTPAASPAGMPFPPRPTSQPTVMAGMSPRPSSQPQRIPSGLQAQHMHGNIANGHTRVEPPIQRAPSASAQFPGQGTALTETGQIPQALQGGPFPTPGAPGAGPQQPQRHPSMSLGSTPTQLAIVQRNKATGEAQPMGAQNGPVRPPSSGSMQRAAVPIPPGQMPPTQAGSVGLPIPRPNLVAPASFGQAYHKLLQFSGQLADEVRHNKSSLTFWENLVESYFTPTSITKLTLWREQGNEAKPFEISVPILARYFLVTHQSGVKSMHWSLDGGQETQNSNDAMRLMFNCNAAIWTHRYANGYTIALRGPLQATVCLVPNTPNTQPPYVWKIDSLQFDATSHEKFLSTSAILGHRTTEQSKAPRAPTLMNGATTLDERGDDQPRVFIDKAFIPSEPVNAFGIPQATMRCLELAESVAQMVPLIQYSCDHNLGPLDSLKQYTRELREGTSAVPPHPVAGFAPGAGPSSFSNVPGPSQPPQQAPALSSVPPDSPTKTNRPGPSGAQPPTSTTPAPLPRASSSTPTMTPASLKRKADGNAAASTSEPQPKRNQRKRGGTTSKS